MTTAPDTPVREAESRPFDGPAAGRRLLRTIRSGSLATLDPETGAPFCSLVTVATAMDGSPLLLLSRLAAHTANLDRDPRASLLLAAGGKGDPLAHPRLTVAGVIEPDTSPDTRRRFLARHPKAQLYADFPDFGFRRLRISAGHLNGGFARAARLEPDDLLCDLVGADALLEREAGAVGHVNADHPDAVRRFATHLAGEPDGDWRLTGVDPDGMDLMAGDRTARVLFPAKITSPEMLRQTLVELARLPSTTRNDVTASDVT